MEEDGLGPELWHLLAGTLQGQEEHIVDGWLPGIGIQHSGARQKALVSRSSDVKRPKLLSSYTPLK